MRAEEVMERYPGPSDKSGGAWDVSLDDEEGWWVAGEKGATVSAVMVEVA